MVRGLRGSSAAETGVGTSIIFIALVLVSGAAGSVLLDTTDTSSEQARTVFDDALADTVNGLDVRGVVGAADESISEIVELYITISLIAGSGPISLGSLVVEIITPDGFFIYDRLGENGTGVERLTERTSNVTYLAQGHLYLARVPLPDPAESGETVVIRFIPSSGFTTTIRVAMPDVIAQKYITLR